MIRADSDRRLMTCLYFLQQRTWLTSYQLLESYLGFIWPFFPNKTEKLNNEIMLLVYMSSVQSSFKQLFKKQIFINNLEYV